MVKDPRAPQGAHRIIPVNRPLPIAVECDASGVPVAVGMAHTPAQPGAAVPHHEAARRGVLHTPAGGEVEGPLPPCGGGLGRGVAAIQSRWRIDDEWWRERPISRLYYSLLLEDGRLLTVFQDLHTGQWHEQHY